MLRYIKKLKFRTKSLRKICHNTGQRKPAFPHFSRSEVLKAVLFMSSFQLVSSFQVFSRFHKFFFATKPL